MSHSKADLDKADPITTLRNRRAASFIVMLIIALLALIVLPFGMQNKPIADFCTSMSFLMAGGMIVAGLWSAISYIAFSGDEMTDEEAEDRQSQTVVSLVIAVVLTVVLFLAVWLATSIGSSNWAGYTLLKSLGLVSYILLGLSPVVTYALLLHSVATQQIITSLKWRILAILCLVWSLLSPWVWSGYKLYLDYHHV